MSCLKRRNVNNLKIKNWKIPLQFTGLVEKVTKPTWRLQLPRERNLHYVSESSISNHFYLIIPFFSFPVSFISCRQVLNFMVILGFMFNYMLRVNLTIAIVEMVYSEPVSNSTTNVTVPQVNETADHGPKFHWDKFQQNEALGSFFWGYILTELPGEFFLLFGQKLLSC